MIITTMIFFKKGDQDMKRKTRSFIIALCTLAFGIMLITPVIYAADEITITGVIFSSEGIIRTTDRQEYII